MGYSVYVVVGARQLELIKKILQLPGIGDNPFIQWASPVFEGRDIAYDGGRHENSHVFAVNYGTHPEFAHALVNLVARLLGKKKYWLDGIERLSVKDASWWRRRGSLMALSTEMDKVLKIFERKFNEARVEAGG